MGEGRGGGGAESERRQEIGGHRLQWNVHWWRVSFFVFIPHRVSCVGPLIRSDKPGLWKSGRFTPTANRRTTGSHPQHWDHTHARGPRVCVCMCVWTQMDFTKDAQSPGHSGRNFSHPDAILMFSTKYLKKKTQSWRVHQLQRNK